MRNFKFYAGFIILATADALYIITICIYYFVEVVKSDPVKIERAIRLCWLPGVGLLIIILTLSLFLNIMGWPLVPLISGILMMILYEVLVIRFQSPQINPMSGLLLFESCALLKWSSPLAIQNVKYIYLGVTCKEYILIQRKRIKKDSSMKEECCRRMCGNCPQSNIV
jgi:hypothetical protein